MPRTLTETIELESVKSRLRVIDLLKVSFPQPIGTVFWSTTVCNYAGNTYLPRIQTIGDWTRTLSAETDELSIELSNVDGEITKIYNNTVMELAEITLIRYFPDLDEALDPLWIGWGGTVTLKETTATWDMHFGMRGMTQKGLRKITATCWKLFADGVYCPYDPDGDDGGCSTLSSSLTTAGTSVEVNDTDYYVVGDVLRIEEELLLVTAVNSNLTVTRAYNDTTAAPHTSGLKVYHASCDKTYQSCDRRRMYGPPTESDGFRYFGGWVPRVVMTIAGSNFTGYLPETTGWLSESIERLRAKIIGRYITLNYQSSGPPGGTFETIPGKNVLPVAYGQVRMKGVVSTLVYDIDEYVHSLHLVAEGQITALSTESIRVDSLLLREPDLTPPDKRFSPCVVFFGGIGQRESYSATYDEWIDTYEMNPAVFNTSEGEGGSLSDVFAIYTQAEQESSADRADSFKIEESNLDIQFVGRFVRTIQGWIDDDDDQITLEPNPIEVAVDYCVNGKFGPRLDVSKIDLNAALLESEYCNELVTSTDEADNGAEVKRFTFNGVIDDDDSAEAHLDKILQNCNGYYIQNNGKLVFGIRKAVDLDDVAALPLLTDYGTDINIRRENGVSTLTVSEVSGWDGYANQVNVSFKDRRYGLQDNSVQLYDDIQQQLAADILASDATRSVNVEELNLNGTISLDQAQRLGVLFLREQYMKRNKFTFQMSLRDSLKLAPGDVRRLVTSSVDGDPQKRLSTKATYVRIWKIIETDKFTATIEAYRHENGLYDNEV